MIFYFGKNSTSQGEMYFKVAVLVPQILHEQIEDYVETVCARYDEKSHVPPYIVMTYQNLCTQYEKFRNSTAYTDQYDTLEKYRLLYCGYYLVDTDGHVLSTDNPESFFDSYRITQTRTVDHFLSLPDSQQNPYYGYLDLFGQYVGNFDHHLDDETWSRKFDALLKLVSPEDYLVELECHV